MMPRQIQAIFVALIILLGSLFVGHAVAAGDYYLLILLMVFLPVGIAAVIVPGYEFFLAFGLLCPFAFPIPFVYQFPLFGLILGFCCFKLAFSRGMDKTRIDYQNAFNLVTIVFFMWVVVRYCMNPVRPGVAIGTGTSVTGFRAYLSYGICFALVMSLGWFLRDRVAVARLIKWMGVVSICFVALFIPLTFSKSLAIATMLMPFGLNISFFDNGWLRFVTLPGFGLILVILSLLPNLFPVRRSWRIVLFCVGILAILMGGNRSSVGMAFVAVLTLTLIRRGMGAFLGVSAAMAICLLTFNYLGQNLKFEKGVGFFRVLALVSDRVARETEAGATYQWRQVRWELAMFDVRKHPWMGVGYGGLGSAYAFAIAEGYEQNNAEIDVAAGSIHNGFLAGARAFGVPFCLLFIWIIGSRIFVHFRESMRQRERDPFRSDLHGFVLANMITLPIAIYFGSDLNGAYVWFYIALGFIVSKLKTPEAAAAVAVANQPETQLPSPPGRFGPAPG